MQIAKVEARAWQGRGFRTSSVLAARNKREAWRKRHEKAGSNRRPHQEEGYWANPSPSAGASAAPPTRHFPSDLGPFASRLAASPQHQVVHLSRRKTLFPRVTALWKAAKRRQGNFEKKKKAQGALNGFRQCFQLLLVGSVCWHFLSTQTHNCVSSVTWFPSRDEPDRVDFLN